jgi:DNA-binding MarR family transcriptional regulator
MIYMLIMEFTEREKNVCRIIYDSEKIRFTDIKKKSGLHQEILSRILKRIGDDCSISKSRDGYECVGTSYKNCCTQE